MKSEISIPTSQATLRRIGLAEKVYHFAALFSEKGGASALCYVRPRAINLKAGQSWTIREEAVTCPKCIKAIAASTEKLARALSAPRPEGSET